MFGIDLSGLIERHSIFIEVLGYTAAALALAANAMKTMIPLRIMSIIASVLFIGYGFLLPSYPQALVHCVLLPLHTLRLKQMTGLIADVRKSAGGDLALDALLPYAKTRPAKAGETVFAKGDDAESMYYTRSGRYELVEIGVDISPGQVVGEIGLVEEDNRRTQTFRCVEDGELLAISYDRVKELYFQNPQFGFHFLNLISKRLMANNARLVAEVEKLRAEQGVKAEA